MNANTIYELYCDKGMVGTWTSMEALKEWFKESEHRIPWIVNNAHIIKVTTTQEKIDMSFAKGYRSKQMRMGRLWEEFKKQHPVAAHWLGVNKLRIVERDEI